MTSAPHRDPASRQPAARIRAWLGAGARAWLGAGARPGLRLRLGPGLGLGIGLGPGAGLITSSVTFLATANAVRYCDADVLFCDVDGYTGLITPETLDAAILQGKKQNLNIKAVIVVHLTGRPVHMKEIQKMTGNVEVGKTTIIKISK